MSFIFLSSKEGFEEASLCVAEVKNMPEACFLGRGKIHILMNAPSMGVGMGILFVAVISNSIYSVQQTQKTKDILPDVLYFLSSKEGFER